MAKTAMVLDLDTGRIKQSDSDFLESADAVVTPSADKVVKAGSNSKIDVGWMPVFSSSPAPGWQAWYWNNYTHSGTPVSSEVLSLINRTSSPGGFGNYTSARFEGYVWPQYNETYTITTNAGSSYKLYIDDVLFIEVGGYGSATNTVACTVGTPLYFKYDWKYDYGGCWCYLHWQSASQSYDYIATPYVTLDTVSTSTGDVGGSYDTNVVVGLQARPVADTAPSLGNILTWNGSAWSPSDTLSLTGVDRDPDSATITGYATGTVYAVSDGAGGYTLKIK